MDQVMAMMRQPPLPLMMWGNVYVTGYNFSSGINFDYATIKYSSTGIQEGSGCNIHCSGYSLLVSPNPFHDFTDIRYQIADTSKNVDLIIYDVTGCQVKEFSGQSSTLGPHLSVRWNGTDDAGKKLPSGIYFMTCRARDHRETKKILLIR